MEKLDLIAALIKKQQDQSLSSEEQKLLDDWKAADPRHRELAERLNDRKFLLEELRAFNDAPRERIIRKIDQAVPVRSHRVFVFRKWAVAASVLLVVAASIYYFFTPAPDPSGSGLSQVAPARDGAVLTLADGSEVLLDSVGNGLIADQNGTKVMLTNGVLAYDAAGTAEESVAYNTMRTPNGRKFNLKLPDGTLVWLNAGSSIRYPTRFVNNERRVEVSGEAYFEVENISAMPFRVNIDNKALVEVLGTEFNVNAYADEPLIRTTLLKGAVRVSALDMQTPNTVQGTAGILKPGQQAVIPNDGHGGHQIQMQEVETDPVVAWKNGVFNFENVDFEGAMRQIQRWYDIDVVYENGVPDIRFGGKLMRTLSLNDLLEVLSKAEVHYRLEGERRLVVIKKQNKKFTR